MNQQQFPEPELRLVSVNIEADKHLSRVLPFVAREQPDIVCLQEVFAADLPLFEKSLGMHSYFVPMTLRPGYAKSDQAPLSWGIALLTRAPLQDVTTQYYATYGRAPGEIILSNGQQSSVQKALLSGTVTIGSAQFHIGTTHFTWSPDGEATDEQRQDLAGLLTVLAEHPHIVFCGDFNAPRGREICNTLEQHYKGNLPAHITTTIDQHLHRVPGIQLAVDNIFSTPEYAVSNVQVIDGVSDHCALTATITPTVPLLPATHSKSHHLTFA